jgi:hypothetical protein
LSAGTQDSVNRTRVFPKAASIRREVGRISQKSTPTFGKVRTIFVKVDAIFEKVQGIFNKVRPISLKPDPSALKWMANRAEFITQSDTDVRCAASQLVCSHSKRPINQRVPEHSQPSLSGVAAAWMVR